PRDVATTTGTASDGTGKKKGMKVTLTTYDMQKRKNNVKGRITLLLSLPDKHQLRFIKGDLDTMSLDDLYKHLKVYESEVQKKSEPNSQNMAFISSAKHSNGNEEVNIANGSIASINVSTASANIKVASISQDTACAYIASQSSVVEEEAPLEFALMAKTSAGSEVFDNSLCSKACKKNYDSLNSKITELTDKLCNAKNMIYHYKLKLAQVEARLAEHRNQELKYFKKIRVLEFKTESRANCIESLTKDLELLKKEKGELETKLTGFQTASKDLDSLLESQRLDKNKEGLGYNTVPPPPAQIYSPPKKDLSWTGLLEFADDTVTDYSMPSPTIESTLDDAQNRNPSVTETEASPTTFSLKPFIKFVKATDRSTETRTAKVETAKPHVNKRVKKETSRSQNNTHKSFTPRPAVHRPYRPPIRPVRPNMNVAQPKRTSFHKPTHSYNKRPFQRTSAVRSQFRDLRVATVNRKFPNVNRKLPTVNRKFPTGNTKFSTVDMGNKGNADSSQNNIDDKGYWDSGCFRQTTGNISYLSDYKPFDGGYVSFVQGGCKITNKGTIKTECIVFGRNFKLSDDTNVLLRTPRQHNMYLINLKNIILHKDLTCLVAKASADEGMLWHRRLGKQHKASCKSKLVNSVTKPLHTMHMDLFGPTSVSSISHKWYCLVVTDDFSRFTWTFFLKTKDETSGILRKFITEIENLRDLKVKIIRVLVNKSHNKTLYELFNGRSPAIGFLKPFGCHVMILNTLDHLGMFEAKGDEGTNSTNLSGTKDAASQEVKKDVSSLRYNTLPKWVHDALLESSSSTPQDDYSTDVPESSGNYNPTATLINPSADQVETLTVETLIPTTNRFEDILGVTTNFDELNGVEADVSNMETTIIASPTPTLRIHKDHPKSQIIGPVDTPIQTRNKSKEVGEQSFIAIIHQKTDPALLQLFLFSCFLSQVEPKKISDALQDLSRVEAMQEELLQFKIQNVWSLVNCPKGVRPIGTKWVLKNKKDERGIVIRNKARIVAQGHTQEEGIDYDEVFASVERIKAMRLFLAYASFMGFTDPKFPAKVYKVEKAMYGLHQAPRAGEFEALMHEKFQMSAMGELNFFLGLQVLKKEDDIFLSQDKYVGDILKKFGYSDVKSSNTPMDKQNPWGKDKTGKDVDLHLYRSMIGSLMYLTAYRPDIMFAVCAYAKHQNPWGKDKTGKDVDLHLYRSMIGSLMYLTAYRPDIMFAVCAYAKHQVTPKEYSNYGGATEDRKSTTRGSQFLGRRLISWHCKKQTIVATSTTKAEYVAVASGCGQVLLSMPCEALSKEISSSILRLIETTEEGTKILATVDGKLRTVFESSIRRNLKLNDEEGIRQFSHQWKYLIHTIMQCLSPKSTGFNEFSSNIATALVCLATNRVYNFSKMIFDGMVKNVNNKVSKFLMYPRFLSKCLKIGQFRQIPHTQTYVKPFHTSKIFTTLRVNSPSFSGRIVPFLTLCWFHRVKAQEHQLSPITHTSEALQSSQHVLSSPSLPPIPTESLPNVIPSDNPPLRQYTRRTRIDQSLFLPPVADEPAYPHGDGSQGEACPIDSSFVADQDRANIAKTSTVPSDSAPMITSFAVDEGSMPQKLNELTASCTILQRQQSDLVSKFEAQELEITMLKARVKQLEDREEGVAERSGDDAPIKGRSGVAEVPTGSGSIPTVGPPATGIPTGSDVVPTAGLIFASATVVTPYKRRKGKEKMIKSETLKKKRIQEQMDIQMARQLEEEMEREAQRMNEQIARDAEIARLHAEEELQIMIDGLDRSNETIAKYQDNYAKVHKYQTLQRKPRSKKQNKDYYMAIEDFILMSSKEETERFKKKGPRLEQVSEKKLKTSEEVPEEVLKDKRDGALVELKRLYEPDDEDQLWSHTHNLMHAQVEWKLYDTCRVHHVTSKDKEIFMLVEKDYPLRKGLAIVMISYKLDVENYSQMEIIEFPLLEEVPTASKESSHYQKKRDATAVKICTATKVKKRVQVVPTAAEVATAIVSIPTGSRVVPTATPTIPTAAQIFTTATNFIPYTRTKGKEMMVESDTPKKKKLQKQIDV
nr:hypothetical protein [Tanacetum cinerariifolium]